MNTLALLIGITFTTAYAAPSTLTPRVFGVDTKVLQRDGETWTIFSPDWPTCANDRRLTNTVLNPPHPNNVTVRPDCDEAIDIICRAADREASRPEESQNMTSISHTVGTCEGHLMMYYQKLIPGSVFGYDWCVRGFQSITETCMLVDDPTVSGKNYASWEHQAGAMNVAHHRIGTPTSPSWAVATEHGDVGYMMGPTGYFGYVPSIDADDVPAYSRQGPTMSEDISDE